MNKYLIPGIVGLVVIVGGVAYAKQSGGLAYKSGDAMTKTEDVMKKDATASPTPDAAMMAKEKEQEAMSMKKDAGASDRKSVV